MQGDRCNELDTRSEGDFASEYAIWADLDIVCEFDLIIDNRCGVDLWHAESLGRVRMIEGDDPLKTIAD